MTSAQFTLRIREQHDGAGTMRRTELHALPESIRPRGFKPGTTRHARHA